jgi:drug/metabolite transporter (DMT)-like permease
VVFGSLVGYTCYIWLLRVSTPAKVATYAYVNPLVAVALGWLLAGEELTQRMVAAALVIIAGVAVVTMRRRRPPEVREPVPGPGGGLSGGGGSGVRPAATRGLRP